METAEAGWDEIETSGQRGLESLKINIQPRSPASVPKLDCMLLAVHRMHFTVIHYGDRLGHFFVRSGRDSSAWRSERGSPAYRTACQGIAEAKSVEVSLGFLTDAEAFMVQTFRGTTVVVDGLR